ncbi:drug/metabolite transporter (DMT)-like permease [Rubricella aquisinus]|uniref:Drug/metabolite transporter (DMT)-like permease n=1 Tax=Rubricella aquisinus TaxID=2028108 RepID=A0A840WT45_9RHOB|nr:DMT family transporter [Rubricella aquisinus]MBB5517173.1 drug/metabolite transporter (DMT)-like permease [Rubricella aquisinus]
MTPARAGLVALLGVIVLAPDALLIKTMGLPAPVILFWRGVMQFAVVTGALILIKRGRLWPEMRAAGWLGVGYCVTFGFSASGFVFAASHTTVANTLFLVATSPVWAAIIGWIFLGERITWRVQLTILAVLIGIGLIAVESAGGEGVWYGDLAALICAFSLAVALTITRAAKGVSFVPMTGGAGVVIAFCGIAMGGLALPTPEALPKLLLMGMIIVPVSFSLITIAARYLVPAETSLILLLEAPFGLFVVWLMLGDAPGPLALLGGMIVLAAIGALNISRLIRTRRSFQP